MFAGEGVYGTHKFFFCQLLEEGVKVNACLEILGHTCELHAAVFQVSVHPLCKRLCLDGLLSEQSRVKSEMSVSGHRMCTTHQRGGRVFLAVCAL